MSRIRFATAREVFETFPTLREDVEAAPAEEAPVQFIRKLASGPTPEDAVSFSAYMLARREAVWWGAQCVRQLVSNRTPEEDKALLIVEAWIREPEEHRRRAAMNAGEAGDPRSAVTWLAHATGWSGGSMTAPEMQPVPAPPHLTAKAVRAAVLIALAKSAPRERAERIAACTKLCLRFIESGQEAQNSTAR